MSIVSYVGIELTCNVEPHFRYCCSVWGSCGKTDLNELQKLQNRAARIVMSSRYDAPSKPLLQKHEWKTIVELIANETKMMVFKSLNDFGPQYMHNMCTKNSQLSERNLRNTTTDLRLPLRHSTAGRKASHTEVPRCGIASQLSAKKQDHYVSSNPS